MQLRRSDQQVISFFACMEVQYNWQMWDIHGSDKTDSCLVSPCIREGICEGRSGMQPLYEKL